MNAVLQNLDVILGMLAIYIGTSGLLFAHFREIGNTLFKGERTFCIPFLKVAAWVPVLNLLIIAFLVMEGELTLA